MPIDFDLSEFKSVEGQSRYLLVQAIIDRSVANVWDEAKLEWALEEVYEVEEPDTCLCGHFPIIEVCVLRNRLNGRLATVGNVCVKKFIGLPSDKIFQAVKRVRRSAEKALNAETIQHAFGRGWITDWDHRFYLDTMRKRVLSERQLAQRKRINATVIARMQRAG